MASHSAGRFYDLSNRRAMRGTEVDDTRLMAIQNSLESLDMGVGKIGDMHIVPYAGSVACLVVLAKNSHCQTASPCNVQDYRNQMSFWLVVFACLALRICPGRVKVAQCNPGKPGP